ncbi:MAG TPA: ATP-grasp domain-containing protein [Kineosporiaceae bacterium]
MNASAEPQATAADRLHAPLVGLVASGDRRYREYIVAAVSVAYRVWLFDSATPTWQQPYLNGSTLVDHRDPQALAAAVRDVRSAGPVAGLLCYDEWSIVSTAAACAELALPSSPPDAVSACRDKAITRQRLHAAGIPQPRSTVVSGISEALEAARTIGYPVVMKARALAGSIGVLRVDTADGIPQAYMAASTPTFPGVTRTDAVLVEEFLPGPEISIDSAVQNGRCHPLVLARKQVGSDPFFEEIGHLVDAHDPLLHDKALTAQLQDIHTALGITDGMTHTEFRLTPAGPRLVEVNARLGGDFIPRLGYLASGIDLAKIAADIAVGKDITPEEPRHGYAGIRFLYPSCDCTVEDIRTVKGTHPAVVDLLATATSGQDLHLPPRGYLARYGYVMAAGEDRQSVQDALATSEDAVPITFTPMAATDDS